MATSAEPLATRYVREKTGQLTTRDADDKTTYLPSSMSKRGVYRQYCHERGKKVVTAHTVSQVTLEDIPDKEVFECISWSAFLSFWKSNFPHLKVSTPHEDICKECYIFANSHKFLSQTCHPVDNAEDEGSEGRW